MWKYFIIGAVVLFLFAVFVFSKNHDAIVAPAGEIAAVKTQLRDAVAKNKNISLDKTIKAYAEMRTEWMSSEKTRLDNEKSNFDAKTAALKEESVELSAKHERIGGEVENIKSQLDETLSGVSGLVDMSSDDEAEEISKAITDLADGNKELQYKIAEEEKMIAELNAESAELNKQIAAAVQLNKDRQARISPPELECHIITSDPGWDFVILDAGVNKGIVIGSRLAVMRGDQKICELNATSVEASRTSCDVVYSTLVPGERVQPGDRVISVRNNK